MERGGGFLIDASGDRETLPGLIPLQRTSQLGTFLAVHIPEIQIPLPQFFLGLADFFVGPERNSPSQSKPNREQTMVRIILRHLSDKAG